MGVAEEALGDERVKRLMTIPGVEATTAFALVAVIGDVGRFPRPNQLVGYLGLDPRVRQSGDRPAYTGHISRQGQAHARGLLVEAAHSAVRTPGPLRAFHQRTRARRGPQIAAVAVARKLAIVAWHLLHSGTEYRWTPSRLTAAKLRRLEFNGGSSSTAGWLGCPRARGREPGGPLPPLRGASSSGTGGGGVLRSRRRPAVREGRGRRQRGATLWREAGCAAEVSSPSSAPLHGVGPRPRSG
jgi:hypothetical protein